MHSLVQHRPIGSKTLHVGPRNPRFTNSSADVWCMPKLENHLSRLALYKLKLDNHLFKEPGIMFLLDSIISESPKHCMFVDDANQQGRGHCMKLPLNAILFISSLYFQNEISNVSSLVYFVLITISLL